MRHLQSCVLATTQPCATQYYPGAESVNGTMSEPNGLNYYCGLTKWLPHTDSQMVKELSL